MRDKEAVDLGEVGSVFHDALHLREGVRHEAMSDYYHIWTCSTKRGTLPSDLRRSEARNHSSLRE